VNAINIACDVIKNINEHREKVMMNKDPMLGASSLEVTMIRGGERINVTPEKCEIYLDRRLVSNETIEEAYESLQGAIGPVIKKTGARIDTRLLCAYPATSVDLSENIVRLAQRSLEQSGLPSGPVGFPAGCDMWAFRSKNIPTVVLGCGSIAQAHSVDEYVDTGQLNKLAGVYEALIRLTS
jgi:acetylornithine deacetylase/succinyl-diaminopimelate desuccinylase-like protein